MHHEIAERKRKLVAEGNFYRSGILSSKKLVITNLDAKSLASMSLQHLANLACRRIEDIASLKGVTLQTLLPVVLKGLALVSRKSLLKPFIRGPLIAGALMLIVQYATRKKHVV